MKVICAAVVLVAASAASAYAQIPVGTYVGTTMPGGYDSGGRRDPFVSLITPRRPVAMPMAGRPITTNGLRGIALADVAVTGIVRKGNVMLAILHGSGQQQSYVARVNDRIMDAVVKSIDAQGVVFVEVVAPGTGVRPQELRKALRGAAEAYR